jgi:hypothetical protein
VVSLPTIILRLLLLLLMLRMLRGLTVGNQTSGTPRCGFGWMGDRDVLAIATNHPSLLERKRRP